MTTPCSAMAAQRSLSTRQLVAQEPPPRRASLAASSTGRNEIAGTSARINPATGAPSPAYLRLPATPLYGLRSPRSAARSRGWGKRKSSVRDSASNLRYPPSVHSCCADHAPASLAWPSVARDDEPCAQCAASSPTRESASHRRTWCRLPTMLPPSPEIALAVSHCVPHIAS